MIPVKNTCLLFLLLIIGVCSEGQAQQARWTEKRAHDWYQQQGWLVGANFTPSNAVNQLEMWQAATFDTATINKELGYAAGIGMNCMRVYLHHVAWVSDPEGFKKRMHQYLAIAGRHHIKTMFVFFDDCWKDDYAPGPQPAPVAATHNSRWLKDPGNRIDSLPLLMDTLHRYVTDVLETFKKDKRILLWDLYNEPGHFGHGDKSWPLLKNVVAWARAVKLTQPISIGIWRDDFTAFNAYQLAQSDIITFHNYRDSASMAGAIDSLQRYNRPLICTEYMKRPNKSFFSSHLPMMKQNRVGAINWGLVAGKTQTNYPQGKPEVLTPPVIWYHDIFHTDGTPFDATETVFIRQMTKAE
ncbi:1,4-beta-xylanase [Chitinophaga nivalis]|uniref:1,4-beta-xylanase n=1 Tax=Chitinophaga nivalis TaxID=2991709 RepID=A0ABT3IHD5_9BACT|nr:1,4-beta-xylanase [Chitinophaga nivalis]MCW3466948.1 1,4-beta-xylanase [Chitinophaga nivalis]MCW3483361.1 1,4-beta-xylanase [Chitinophaga nivalis]